MTPTASRSPAFSSCARPTPGSHRVRRFEIDVLTKAGYGAAFDTDKLIRGLSVASQALNDGDLGRAMIATLHLRLPELDAAGAARLAAVDAVLAKYSPDQPRDWHGRWTSDGEGSGAPSQAAAETKRPAARESAPHREDQANSATNQAPSNARQMTPPSDAERQVSHPTGGRLIDTRYQGETDDGDPGIGDNGGPPFRPGGPQGTAPEPDPVLPIPKVPPGWDQPYRVVNGAPRPAGRYPKLPDGRPWPTAQAEEIYRILDPRRGAMPFVNTDRGPTVAELASLEAALPDQPVWIGGVLAGNHELPGWWGPGRTAGWADAIEAARSIGSACHLTFDVRAAQEPPWHPGRCAALYVRAVTGAQGDEHTWLAGHAGELHPRVVAAYGLPPRTCAFELDFAVLATAAEAAGPVRGPSLSAYPLATQDVALVVPNSVPAADVAAALAAGAGDLLEDVRLFDVYTGAQLGADRKSLAYTLRFRAPDRTLTVAETTAARDAAVAEAGRRVGAVPRVLSRTEGGSFPGRQVASGRRRISLQAQPVVRMPASLRRRCIG